MIVSEVLQTDFIKALCDISVKYRSDRKCILQYNLALLCMVYIKVKMIWITSKTTFGIWSTNLEPATEAGYHRPRESPEACHQTNSGPQRNELLGTTTENTPTNTAI